MLNKLATLAIQALITKSVDTVVTSYITKQQSSHNQKIQAIKEEHYMKVNCIKESNKDAIVELYTKKVSNITELAKAYDTSNRTIGRVLEERGIASPVPRLQGEAYLVMKLLKDYDVTIYALEAILIEHAENTNAKR